tara:strand:- start:55 stop:399 length:345 start_codon:yes stop_codon:yes gene_type:complete
MKKMLYFQTAADDAAAFPADKLYAIDAGTTFVKLHFDGATSGTGSAGIGGLLSSVGLTVTAGQEEAALKAIVQKINEGPHSDGLIVIADDANGVYAHSGITACGTITVDIDPAT